MDYGNEEKLSYTQLRPLHHKFCSLPCQAICCCLKNAFSLSQQSITLHSSICDWFSSLLLGKCISISISECKGSNHISSEVLFPILEVKKSLFPTSVLEMDLKNDLISMSSLIDSIGFCHADKCHIDSKKDNLHISHLPPLIVKLNSSLEFTCLMSHVTDEAHFYVHPIQEDLAHNMNLINDELYDHYTMSENCIPLPLEDLKCGILCSVYSVEFQQWCRGVITRIKHDISERLPTCLIFFLDYGGTEWIEACKIFYLISSVKKFPSQVVCCNFEEITNYDDFDSEVEVLMNPDLASHADNCYTCSVSQKEVLSQCVQFLKSATEEKSLFIVVKGKGTL